MKNTSGENSRDSGVLSAPLSFLRSGFYFWYYASLNNRGDIGIYWTIRSSSTTNSSILYVESTSLTPQNGYFHGLGYAVRCVKIP